jgi:GTP-binding protein
VLANKWDLVERAGGDRAAEVRAEIHNRLRFLESSPIFQICAKTGAGVGRVLPSARKLSETADRRIPTAELNRWLRDCTRRHEPAMGQRGSRRRPLKFFYVTQTAVRPPTFVLFCTDPDAVQASYRRFLENRLRETFGFEGTPIRLRLRSRANNR